MVVLHLLILIYLTVVKCFQISPRHPSRISISTTFGQCQTNHHRLNYRYILTSFLKSCADTFSILISHLANLSFTQAFFPSKFKLALISPLLKKPGLPKSDLRYPIWIPSAKSLSVLPFHVLFLTVFLRYNLRIANFILLRLLCLN